MMYIIFFSLETLQRAAEKVW